MMQKPKSVPAVAGFVAGLAVVAVVASSAAARNTAVPVNGGQPQIAVRDQNHGFGHGHILPLAVRGRLCWRSVKVDMLS